MSKKLEGKVAVVTGGSAGIGLGTAKRFAEEGARVFITGRRQSELAKAVAAIGGNATAIQGDASQLADIDRIYAKVKALALLSKDASVILTGSIASSIGIPSFSVYNATKAAVRSFARSWILDLKGRGIRVHVLSPGHIDTPGLSVLMTDEQKAGVLANVPLGRLGTPDDIGGVAAFLASD